MAAFTYDVASGLLQNSSSSSTTVFTYRNDSSTVSAVRGSDTLDAVGRFREAFFTHREASTISLICLYVPVFSIAFFGNLLVLLVVIPNKHMRNVTNCFIVNLAVADLLVTIVCVPMAIGQSVTKVWLYGGFMCKITAYLQGVSVASSVFTIMVLSLDRFLAIRHPMTFRTFCHGKHTVKIVVIIWMVSIGIMVPLIMVREIDKFDLIPSEPMHFCNEVWDSQQGRRAYDIFLFIFMFVMPGCFITTSYSLIGRKLWSEGKVLYRGDSQVGRKQAEKVMAGRQRVARMLIVVAALFGVCWMPYHLLSLYLDFVIQVEESTALNALPFTILLGHSNSALNPILYCFMNKSFRKCTAKLLRCKKKTVKKPNNELPMKMMTYYSRHNGNSKITTRLAARGFRNLAIANHTRSTSGSLRLSRTSSLKSATTTATHTKCSPAHRNTYMMQDASIVVHKNCDASVQNGHDSKDLLQHKQRKVRLDDDTKAIDNTLAERYQHCDESQRERREIFSYALNIPTTINEESSRRSSAPVTPITENALPHGLSDETGRSQCEISDQRSNDTPSHCNGLAHRCKCSDDDEQNGDADEDQMPGSTPSSFCMGNQDSTSV